MYRDGIRQPVAERQAGGPATRFAILPGDGVAAAPQVHGAAGMASGRAAQAILLGSRGLAGTTEMPIARGIERALLRVAFSRQAALDAIALAAPRFPHPRVLEDLRRIAHVANDGEPVLVLIAGLLERSRA